jgi:hypothetical protein
VIARYGERALLHRDAVQGVSCDRVDDGDWCEEVKGFHQPLKYRRQAIF